MGAEAPGVFACAVPFRYIFGTIFAEPEIRATVEQWHRVVKFTSIPEVRGLSQEFWVVCVVGR